MTDQIESADQKSLGERLRCYLHSPGDSYQMLGWTLAWAISFVAAAWIFSGDSAPTGATAWIVALVPNLFAVAVVLVYLRFLRDADELVKRIQLEGLGFGFGVGVLFAMGYQLLGRVGAPELDWGDMAAIMMLAFVVGVIRANRRYS